MNLSFRSLMASHLRMYRFRDGMLEVVVDNMADGSIDLNELFEEDDIILLCSPELYDYLPTDIIEYVLTMSTTPEEELCERAQENGAPDTMTILLAQVGGGDIGLNEDDLPDDDGRFDWYA